ncbi:hypothetical protein THASP1DRAFT_21967 [Thamnocephalis sphaerospora]|uniref:BOD1/SHG1 domain-containing protein n=1 Tax=Thamnocephalis sphaerospora TaxID=78915 RepID=A0A4P9XVN0_9FUNG|nr:hypothetical protein THASP1DRAFT_21967 [Thamnocephalis sphaerospora]|eukprot:RKP10318.1 hypothetical protein THASP1DRAFT_21967 [Thamnocephalis sphaerospora]
MSNLIGAAIRPEDLVEQVKQRGAFDRMRKQLLADFQEHEEGHLLLEQVDRVARELYNQSPHAPLSRAQFHRAVLDRLKQYVAAGSSGTRPSATFSTRATIRQKYERRRRTV